MNTSVDEQKKINQRRGIVGWKTFIATAIVFVVLFSFGLSFFLGRPGEVWTPFGGVRYNQTTNLPVAPASVQYEDKKIDTRAEIKRIDQNRPIAAVHFEKGKSLLQQMRWDAAVIELRLAVGNDSTVAEHHYLLGVALLKKAEALPHRNREPLLREAAEACSNAIKFDPKCADSYVIRGTCYGQMRGRESEANEDFKIAIELEPESAGAWQGLADQSLGRGEIDKAIEQYQVAVKLDPLLKWAWKNLAYAFAKIRQFDNAVNAAKMALKVDPNFPEALSDLERFQRAKETVNTTQTLGGSMPVTK